MGVPEMTWILNGHRPPGNREAGQSAGFDQLGDQFGDVPHLRRHRPAGLTRPMLILLEVGGAARSVGDDQIDIRERGHVPAGETACLLGVTVVGGQGTAARLGGGHDHPEPGPP